MSVSDLQQYRRAVRQQAGNATGIDHRQDRISPVNRRLVGVEADVLSLPSEAADYRPLMVMDPSDGDFGKLIFVVGISILGGTDVVR